MLTIQVVSGHPSLILFDNYILLHSDAMTTRGGLPKKTAVSILLDVLQFIAF